MSPGVQTTAFPIPISVEPSREILPETRCYHLDLTRPLPPEALRQEIELAATAGFNVVLIPAYLSGYTLFQSESALASRMGAIHPHYKGRDVIAEAVEAADRLRVSVWAMARPYNLHPRYSTAPQRLLKKNSDWRMRAHPAYRWTSFRKREPYMACPLNPGYRRLLGDIFTELVAGYPVQGLVINYTGFGIRWGPLETSPFCFCESCCERYATQTGGEMISDALDEHGLQRVRNWQNRAAQASVEYLRHRIMKTRRTLRLVARAAPQWRWSPEDTGNDLQSPFVLDWNSLLNSGIVEEALIDHEEEDAPEVFSARLAADLAYLHDEALVLPALYLKNVADLAEPVAAIRRYPVAGILVEFAEAMTRRDAERIRETFFNEPARSPDDEPLMAVAFLLHRVQGRHRDNDLINDFMRDFLRMIEIQALRGTSFETLQLILDNLAGLQTAIRRGRLGDYRIPEITLRDIGLARRIIRLACLDVRG